ncbi:MAG: response regulator transcription factor [Candidatus Methylomirabilis oxyfera]|nr:response regulator transcription factor [Candidatus Methylomirabilis oxyfera]
MTPYRVIVAADHSLFRSGLRSLLEKDPAIHIVEETGNGLELLSLLERVTTDLVILDISLPGLRGIEAIHEIQKGFPGVGVLVLTMHNERAFLQQALAAGAQGYLLKDNTAADLFSAIERIRQGNIYISQALSEGMDPECITALQSDSRPFAQPERLTIREKEVLKLIVEGKTSKEIGNLLFISFRTVNRHRSSIMRKLHVNKNTDLVKYAIQHGYI